MGVKYMNNSHDIEIINANQNNLKHISVNIKKHTFTAVTGVSGSGKSSLVFDVLYAEGQRKFFEINNSNMSTMVGSLNKANVDAVKGLNPVIALEQKKSFNNPRSTVGTLTGIHNMLRSLYSMVGTGNCPICNQELHQVSASHLVGMLMTLPDSYQVEIRRELVKQSQMLRKANGEDITINSTRQCMSECLCPECNGSRLKKPYVKVKFLDKNIRELAHMQLNSLLSLLKDNINNNTISNEARLIMNEIIKKLGILCEIGLHYLNIDRKSDTLSGGEMQRIKLSSQIGSDMMGIIFVMDEPSIGLHAKDVLSLVKMMKRLSENNTMVVVEHDMAVIREADQVIEIGPGSGSKGGNIVFNGTYQELLKCKDSITKKYLLNINKIKPCYKPRKKSGQSIKIFEARENNLKNIDVEIPLNQVVCVTGVSGSGKSTLVNSILVKQLQYTKNKKLVTPGKHDRIEGMEYIHNVINIDQKMIGTSTTSSPATYMGLFDTIRKLYAEIPECKEKGYTAQDFSMTKANGLRCHNCEGKGIIVSNIQYMPDIESVCPVCLGTYFSAEARQFKYNGKDIAEVLKMSVSDAREFFADNNYLCHKLDIMIDLGLDYLKLGQHTTTISGGEGQRLNLAYEISKRKGNVNNLYVFDEPSVGLHPSDIEQLIYSINKLVDNGNSAIIIEHDIDIIKTADYIIDIGPDGGDQGGQIVAQGTPYEVSQKEKSYTGQFLKQYFCEKIEGRQRNNGEYSS